VLADGIFRYHFGPCGIILGHVVSKEGKMPDPQNFKIILDMPQSQRPVDVQVFNGVVQFNRIYIKGYAHVMEPITRLMRKIEEFNWTEQCEAAWQDIKKRYQNAPTLIAPH
jgi:hypothetical protein